MFTERLLRRASAPVGVIDVRGPQARYERAAAWATGHLSIVDGLLARQAQAAESAGDGGRPFAEAGPSTYAGFTYPASPAVGRPAPAEASMAPALRVTRVAAPAIQRRTVAERGEPAPSAQPSPPPIAPTHLNGHVAAPAVAGPANPDVAGRDAVAQRGATHSMMWSPLAAAPQAEPVTLSHAAPQVVRRRASGRDAVREAARVPPTPATSAHEDATPAITHVGIATAAATPRAGFGPMPFPPLQVVQRHASGAGHPAPMAAAPGLAHSVPAGRAEAAPSFVRDDAAPVRAPHAPALVQRKALPVAPGGTPSVASTASDLWWRPAASGARATAASAPAPLVQRRASTGSGITGTNGTNGTNGATAAAPATFAPADAPAARPPAAPDPVELALRELTRRLTIEQERRGGGRWR